jgi:hypothetical protein
MLNVIMLEYLSHIQHAACSYAECYYAGCLSHVHYAACCYAEWHRAAFRHARSLPYGGAPEMCFN